MQQLIIHAVGCDMQPVEGIIKESEIIRERVFQIQRQRNTVLGSGSIQRDSCSNYASAKSRHQQSADFFGKVDLRRTRLEHIAAQNLHGDQMPAPEHLQVNIVALDMQEQHTFIGDERFGALAHGFGLEDQFIERQLMLVKCLPDLLECFLVDRQAFDVEALVGWMQLEQ